MRGRYSQEAPLALRTFGSVEVPGLMLGLSGIGYFYLRLADPAGTPPVLLWRAGGRAAGQPG